MRLLLSTSMLLLGVHALMMVSSLTPADVQLSAQIQADKAKHHQVSPSQPLLKVASSSSSSVPAVATVPASGTLSTSTGGRILRQQPSSITAGQSQPYQYPQPSPSFFLPTPNVVAPPPSSPPPVVAGTPPIPTLEYLPPPVITTPTPDVVVIVEPIKPVTIPALALASTTTAPPTTTSLAPILPTITRPVQPVLAVAASNVVNMALMPQQPLMKMAQIVALDVDCAKESMVVKIKFDSVFSGLIYSKGFHSNLDCHYVKYNTNKDSYVFTIRLSSCGSKWVDELAQGGKAYLENILIIQNEPGIQEVWDSSRAIRCFWEGSLEKTVTYAFNIDMLDTQVVSFSGDSAVATMDIQIGKGPLAPSVNGLVKIGDTLTMVIAIEGDPGFDVQVQDCVAHNGDRANAVTLTDNRGCVLKKKLMGPWQKTTQTGRPGVSLVAFSFFQAFKFPDQMEVFLECNVELCKNGCDVCPDDAPLFDVRSQLQARRRRAIYRMQRNVNGSDFTDVRLRRSLRVISNEDIAYKPSDSRSSTITLTSGE